MKQFGLIGKTLKHSFSKNYFENKFLKLGLPDHYYENFELTDIALIKALVQSSIYLKGFNVTLPFKESIIPHLHFLSDEAKTIGAVNCVKVEDGILKGYNTDVYGFSQSIKPFLDNNHQRALILGTGGASKAVAYALKKLGLEIYFVTGSEKKQANTFFYEEVNQYVINAFKLIVNSTPLGMYPKTEEYPTLPYEHFTSQHLAYDLIYNPEKTVFIQKAAKYGAVTINGLSMLQLQAEKSWEVWND